MKNKKVLIYLLGGIILIGLIIGGILLFGKDKENKVEIIETTKDYVAYVKINPLIKIEYTQTCKNETCNDPTVTKYELINDDAKDIYEKIDLIGTNNSLFEVLNLISKTAQDNDIEFEEVEIYSNWNNLNNYIDNYDKEEYTWSYIINIRDKENLEDISTSLEENKKLYNIDFDTDGGSKINTQTVEEGSLAKEPTNPTKKGYKFIEWQLDGKKYDFNTEIKADITLKAKWEKVETTTDNDEKENEEQKDTSTEKTKTKELSISDVEVKNTTDSYQYNITKKETIKITLTGKESAISKIDKNNIGLYVDVKGLKTGTHSLSIKITGIDSDIKSELNPKTISVAISEKSNNQENNTPPTEDKFYNIEVDVNDITLDEIKDYVYNKRSYVVIYVNDMQGAVCYSSEKGCTLTSPNEIIYIKQVNNAILSKFQIPHTSNGLLLIEGDEIGDDTDYSCKEWYESHPEDATPGTEYSDGCIKSGDEYYGLGLEGHINLLNPPKTKKDLQNIIDNFEYGQGCAGDC